MSAVASQITSVCIVCPFVSSGADQRKHQSSASLTFVRGIHPWPVNSPHKSPATGKTFPFYDVIMVLKSSSRDGVFTKKCSGTDCRRNGSLCECCWLVRPLGDMTRAHHTCHYIDVIWTLWGLKTPATWLFIQQLVQDYNRGNFKAPHYWHFARVIHQWPMDPLE